MLLGLLLPAALAAAPEAPLALYQAAVAHDTAAITAALPRFAACAHPASGSLVFEVALDAAGPKVTVAAIDGGKSAQVQLPCAANVAVDLFAVHPSGVGHQAVFVLAMGPRSARLDGDVALFGKLDKEAIEAGMRTRMDVVGQCYVVEQHTNPTLAGDLTVSFTVLPDGSLYGPSVKRTTLLAPEMEACVVRVLGGARFAPPEAGGIVHVSYPLTFGPA
jgi:hypothetical protein